MKVLIYSHAYPNPVEKTRSAFVQEMVRVLSEVVDITVIAPVPYFLETRRKKHKCKVPAMRKESYGKKTVVIYHPRYILLPRNIFKRFMPAIQAWFTKSCVHQVIRDQKPDLIHVNWAFPDGIAISCMCRSLTIPYILVEHQGGIIDHLRSKLYRRSLVKAYQGAAKVIAVSPSLRKVLCELVPLDKVEMIPNGLDISKMTLTVKPHKPNRLVYIGNLIPEKGVQNLIKALAILKEQGTKLTLDIIGQGDHRAFLEGLTRELSVHKEVKFLGQYTPSEIRKTLPTYHILVLPSLIESFGLVLIEAMACGLPVLSTFSGGPESIVTGETGVLVKTGSALALSDGLKSIITNWDRYEPPRIREICTKNYDIYSIRDLLLDKYQQLMREENGHE